MSSGNLPGAKGSQRRMFKTSPLWARLSAKCGILNFSKTLCASTTYYRDSFASYLEVILNVGYTLHRQCFTKLPLLSDMRAKTRHWHIILVFSYRLLISSTSFFINWSCWQYELISTSSSSSMLRNTRENCAVRLSVLLSILLGILTLSQRSSRCLCLIPIKALSVRTEWKTWKMLNFIYNAFVILFWIRNCYLYTYLACVECIWCQFKIRIMKQVKVFSRNAVYNLQNLHYATTVPLGLNLGCLHPIACVRSAD
jgi:hypothetical protein